MNSQIKRFVAIVFGLAGILLAPIFSQPSLAASAPVESINLDQAAFNTMGNLSAVQYKINDIDCPAAKYCVSVGDTYNGNKSPVVLIGDTTNPSAQSQQRIDALASSHLVDISCPQVNWCAAITFGEDEIAQSLIFGDPTTFGSSAQIKSLIGTQGSAKVPLRTDLQSISCTSPTFCFGVGVTGDYLLETISGAPANWSASNLRISTHGDPSYGLVASCVTESYCAFAGHAGPNLPNGPLTAVSWAGNSKPPLTSAKLDQISKNADTSIKGVSSISGLVCMSANWCLANGILGQGDAGRAVFLIGTPARWTKIVNSNLGSTQAVSHITCVAVSMCAALSQGFASTYGAITGYPLSDPATWATKTPTVIQTHKANEVFALACADKNCLAEISGFYDDVNLSDANQLISFDANDFTSMVTSVPVEDFGFQGNTSINKVVCLSDTSCVAIGNYIRGNFSFAFQQPFNPSNWQAQIARLMPGLREFNASKKRSSNLDDLSCASNYCTAVGTKFMVSSMFFAGSLKPYSVDLQSPFADYGSPPQPGAWGLYANIDCVTAMYCAAIGAKQQCTGYGTDCSNVPLVLYTGQPKSWNYRNGKEIKNGNTDLNKPTAISCFAVAKCVITFSQEGNSYIDTGVPANYSTYFVGDPTTMTTGALVKSKSGNINAIKCFSANSCVAVGHIINQSDPAIFVGKPSSFQGNSQPKLKYLDTGSSAPAGWAQTWPTRQGADGFAMAGFTALSCSSQTKCFAIGLDNDRNAIFAKVNPQSNAAIDVQKVALPASLNRVLLTAISCTANNCYVMGNSDKGIFLTSFAVVAN